MLVRILLSSLIALIKVMPLLNNLNKLFSITFHMLNLVILTSSRHEEHTFYYIKSRVLLNIPEIIAKLEAKLPSDTII